MPRSKRDKKVSLTKTSKKGNLAQKQVLSQAVRTAVEHHDFVYVFSVLNMRNSKLKDLRSLWSDSRFFMGKNKVMQLGLGLSAETEAGKNLHRLAKAVEQQCGLIFTNRPQDEVIQWFARYKEKDYARAGTVATKTVTLPAGPLEQFSFAMETHLRSLGLPTRLDRAIVHLDSDYTVCRRGDLLRPDQTKILKLLQLKLAKFRVVLKCCWSKGTGKLRQLTPALSAAASAQSASPDVDADAVPEQMDTESESEESEHAE